MTGLHYNPSPATLALYSLNREEWVAMRDLGLGMIAAGECTPESTPLRAFSHQRGTALNRRQIGWELTFTEWWTIWQESGRWPERGWGRGYQMCRRGDLGPYAVGNVFIGPGAENLSAAAKVADLPIGVAYLKKGRTKPFRAYCNVGGKQRHLGCFATAGEAHAAYLAALAVDLALKAPQPLARAA